jgi:cytochrome b561
MNPSHFKPDFIGMLVIAFVIYRIFIRVKRLTTRQPVRPVGLRLRSAFLVVIVVLLAVASVNHVEVLEALIAGCAGGVAAGYVGLRGSTFENTPDGLYYTPHRGLGILIALIFLGRIAYRIYQFETNQIPLGQGGDSGPFAALGRSPLTMALFGLLACYVVTYSIGILLWYRRERVATVVVPPPDAVDPPQV